MKLSQKVGGAARIPPMMTAQDDNDAAIVPTNRCGYSSIEVFDHRSLVLLIGRGENVYSAVPPQWCLAIRMIAAAASTCLWFRCKKGHLF
jgi:hypothetical protein